LVAVDGRPPAETHPRVVFRRLDLSRPSAELELAEILESEAVDTVAHVAFLGGPIADQAFAHELEAIGTLNVITASTAANVRRLVVQSTTAVYGAHPRNPALIGEDQPLRAGGVRFLDDRVDAEAVLARHAREHPNRQIAVLRLATVVGPNVRNIATRFLRAGVAPTLLGFDPLVQGLHETDAVEALALAVASEAKGPFNVTAPGVLPLSTALRLCGTRPLAVPTPVARLLLGTLGAFGVSNVPPAFLDYLRYGWVADGERARRELGFVARFTTREAILQTSEGGS
jgi:UDP-glucose 4-epimerase